MQVLICDLLFVARKYVDNVLFVFSAAGLHAKVISGYLKGVGYIPEYKFSGMEDQFRGNWNAVLIYGQWRLIDTHWGARHILGKQISLILEALRHQNVAYRQDHYYLTQKIITLQESYSDRKRYLLHNGINRCPLLRQRTMMWAFNKRRYTDMRSIIF